MATFVFVHGGWGGGWEWRTVADALVAKGHRAFTPTLTGLGERSHLLSPSIGLQTHADDVAETIRWERLRDVHLVGHSYGGVVATVAASMVPDLLGGLIYVDAFIPRDGQSEIDLIDPEWAESMMVRPARELGDGWLVPFPFSDDLDEYPLEVADRYRASWHPLATFTDPALVDPKIEELPRAFIHCTRKAPGEDAFVGFAEAAAERGWQVFDIESGHDVQIEEPDAVTQVLDGLSKTM
jgi:pimeloyl-ACP methyl ester carboxylesterase